jgi:aspartate aminotransferase-like enzyme
MEGNKMVQAIINLSENEDRVLNIVKGKFGLKNKSEAVNLVIDKFEEEFLEPELRPEYAEKLQKLEKEKGIPFKNVAELRKIIEG